MYCGQRESRELERVGVENLPPKVGLAHEEAPAGGRAQHRSGE